jgi:general secretion pathway protein L
MRAQGVPAELLTMNFGSREIIPAFIPAAALAMRAAGRGDDRGFNLRQGSYAYRGEAAALKKTLYGFGGLLAVSLLLFALASGLAYRDRSRRADALLQQMTKQYQETFPGSQLTVDVPLQMQSKLQELRNRAAALGIGSRPQALPILKELAALTARTPYEAEDFSCDETACLLAGSTGSFDGVNRLKEQLGASPLFEKIEVVETRKGIDANRVEFRLRLPLAAEGARP